MDYKGENIFVYLNRKIKECKSFTRNKMDTDVEARIKQQLNNLGQEVASDINDIEKAVSEARNEVATL
eukprot:CAMPEP_0170511232 /NCGR_PEP_ID=MMETSP0208-20121228/66194_1 /TAXON_ID=197538 /ORGANISM="Strombidium inclinatum, Strain S3" /LENGTH=67 /DNA_ID=CAMNT_0010794759 /DNA_START=988 /DNA_END=1191 /DNA_ORIENTATION=-